MLRVGMILGLWALPIASGCGGVECVNGAMMIDGRCVVDEDAGSGVDAGLAEDAGSSDAAAAADGGEAEGDGGARDGGMAAPDAGRRDAGGRDAGVADAGCAGRFFYIDGDGDGFGDPARPVEGCAAPEGYVDNDMDCNDGCRDCFPGGTEVCDGLDNDCAGGVDDSPSNGTVYYRDCDGDGYSGSTMESVRACEVPPAAPGCPGGWVTRVPTPTTTDCNDDLDIVHPGVTRFYEDPVPGTRTNFDYNCDNRNTPDDSFTNDDGVLSTCGNGCSTQGFYAPVPACGEFGDFAACAFFRDACRPSFELSGRRKMPCN